MAYYESWLQKYPIATLEDMFQEDDWDSWIKFLPVVSKYNVPHIADDLTVTNLERIKKAHLTKSINAVIIKPNQNGYILQVKEVVNFCKKN